MRVLITGAGGMVGRAAVIHCEGQGDRVFAYQREQLNISDNEAVAAAFDESRPDAVINCAAWTDVDGCEGDTERAYNVNARGPEVLATQSRRVGSSFVTISTDYVFDGTKSGFYTQRDDQNPQSVYGRAKLDGERRAAAVSARTAIVRTGWVFGSGGKNFLSLVVDLARRGQHSKAIIDAYGTPTYAPHLAARLRDLAELDLPGTYHVANSGEGVSYEEFARTALKAAQLSHVELEPVRHDSLSRPAPRPVNSRLRCLLSEAVGLSPLPEWQEALREFVAASLRQRPN
ncbi:MAG: dTDP-4-dehydrorhamnose reductase [Pyrinomonadaceae bacterium]